MLGSVRLEAARRLGSQAYQLLDGSTRLVACPELQYLAQEDQRHDDGGGLEVDGHLAAGVTKGLRKDPRDQSGDQAIQIRDADSEPYQREHVRTGVLH